MRPCNNLINTPPTLGSKGSEKTTEGRHPLGFLLSGPGAILSGRQSPPGGPDSASRFPRRYTLPFIALLAALTLGLLFLLPGGLLQAQDADGPIPYAENGTGAVATFTGSDPEDRMVYWSLTAAPVTNEVEDTDIADRAHFMINSNGVLSFKFPPDYESPPESNATDNTYKVVVQASDDAPGAVAPGADADDMIKVAYEKVTIEVTDEDEDGSISLSAVQPQESRMLTATLIDDDATPAQIDGAEWKWEHSSAAAGPWTPILTATASAYSLLGVVDKYLRVTATYTDEHGSDKTAQAVSANMVRAAPANNAAPVFTDEDLEDDDIQIERSVDENSPPGTNVGEPVVAIDVPGDLLTYTLTGNQDDGNYRIDQATGQITVGPRTTLDHDVSGGDEDSVTVTATDPAGGETAQLVTITINDVNEAPMMSGGFTRNSQPEYDADDDAGEAGITAAKVVDTYMATDVDQTEAVSWSVIGTDAGDFDIGLGGALTFKEAPNYEMPADSNRDNVYMVTVVATDNDTKQKLTAMRGVTITVTNVDEDGTVTLSSQHPKIGIELTATLEDPDGVVADSVKWTWHAVSDTDGTQATDANDIDMATSDTYTPMDEEPLSAKASYTDGHGAGKSAVGSEADVVANTANVAPKFPETETGMREVAEGTAAGTDIGDLVAATDANEPDTPVLTYTLSGTDAASFSIARSSGQLETKAKLDYETKNSYMVTVTATDSDSASASIAVTIKVTDMDEAPVIAGDDIAEDFRENGSNLEIERFKVTDPEDRMAYWSLATVAVTDEATADDVEDHSHFMISSDGVLSFKFSPDYEAPRGDATSTDNTYKVVVVASDDPPGAGDAIMMDYRKVTVMVTNVDETETITLSAEQAQVNVDLTATYNDLDNERPSAAALMWKWYLGSSEIPDANTNMYRPTSSGSLRVEASYTEIDGSKKTVSKRVSVRAVPDAANVPPSFGEGAGARSVDENSPPGTRVGNPVAAIDPGDTLTYTLGDTDVSSFDINRATGQITVGPRTTLDTETTASYMVTVTATDPMGGNEDQLVTITINDVNEAPTMTGGFTRNSQPEYDADDDAGEAGITAAKVVDTYMATDVDQTEAVSWSVIGTDAGDFDIGLGGALTFKEAPNYEMPADSNRDNVYMVTVVATDNDTKQKLTAMRGVTITVTNVDEDGTVTLSSEQPKIGIELTATLEDPDGVVADSVKWTWHAVSDTDGTQATDANDIDMATSDTYTPMDEEPLSAKASYTDGHGAGKSAVGSEADVVANTANVAPKFPETETGMREVAEGTAAGTDIGDLVAATDANEPNTLALTYTLSGTDAASFSIARPSGQLETKAKLDYETKNSYMVTVTATDSDSASASIAVTIMVTDMDEAPEIMRTPAANVAPEFASATASRTVAENTAADEDIGTPVTATDNNGDTLAYALSGTDAASFDIDPATGQLMTLAALDYETKRTYSVTVTARDSGGLSDSIDVTITVTDVEDDAMPPAGTELERLIARYDTSGNGTIERVELFNAIDEYLFGPWDSLGYTKAGLFDLIEEYLFGG